MAMAILSASTWFSGVAICRKKLQVSCTVKATRRKCAPFLEGRVSKHWSAIPDLWRSSTEKFGDRSALVDPHQDPACEMTYEQVELFILNFAECLRMQGIVPGDHVALFADNSSRWLIADQGIMAMGAANAVRGSRSSPEELVYIYNHSDSVALVVDNVDLLKKLIPGLKSSLVKFIVLLWGSKPYGLTDTPILTYDECMYLGKKARQNIVVTDDNYGFIHPGDIATVVYTSGTTGNPKGVVLTHANLLHQVEHLVQCVKPEPGERFLSLLPPWHMYERAAEYYIFTRGVQQVYTNVKHFRDDLQRYPTHYFVGVPLIYETLYSGVQKQIRKASAARRALIMALLWVSSQYMELKRQLEGKALSHARETPNAVLSATRWLLTLVVATLLLPFHMLGQKLVYKKIRTAIGFQKSGISGGGSLPAHVDRFFEIIGIGLLNGYGLTEASPVVSARSFPDNVLGTVGRPLKHTEVKVVDLETRKEVKAGVRGLVMMRGPQVMKEYYKNQPATRAAVDSEGWLDTGDLGWLAPSWSMGTARRCGGMLVLEGRAKDTIVLLTGENVEPTEIEEAALQSPLIEQIMVVGQDQRRLGALVVPNSEVAASKNKAEMEVMIRRELNNCLSRCSFQIGNFCIISEAFSVENGLLTPTMKLKRSVISEKYRGLIATLFN